MIGLSVCSRREREEERERIGLRCVGRKWFYVLICFSRIFFFIRWVWVLSLRHVSFFFNSFRLSPYYKVFILWIWSDFSPFWSFIFIKISDCQQRYIFGLLLISEETFCFLTKLATLTNRMIFSFNDLRKSYFIRESKLIVFFLFINYLLLDRKL